MWIKALLGSEQVLPFTADKSSQRFPFTDGVSKMNVNGRWAVKFAGDQSAEGAAIAELCHQGKPANRHTDLYASLSYAHQIPT